MLATPRDPMVQLRYCLTPALHDRHWVVSARWSRGEAEDEARTTVRESAGVEENEVVVTVIVVGGTVESVRVEPRESGRDQLCCSVRARERTRNVGREQGTGGNPRSRSPLPARTSHATLYQAVFISPMRFLYK